MTVSIQTTDLRRRVREVLDRVQQQQEPVIVRSYNTPQVVIIPYEEYEAYQAWQARRSERFAWMTELQAIAEEVSARAALSQEESEALIAEAALETRRL
jgi:prevent-host-death family protein